MRFLCELTLSILYAVWFSFFCIWNLLAGRNYCMQSIPKWMTHIIQMTNQMISNIRRKTLIT